MLLCDSPNRLKDGCHLSFSFLMPFVMKLRMVPMKLRLRSDSLRFRLTQGEVSQLLNEGCVRESIHFPSSPGRQFSYSIQAVAENSQVEARLENSEIQVDIPRSLLEPWATTSQVGIESRQPLAEGKSLRVVIEKDWRCLQPRPEEDERDNFPHPLEDVATPSPN